MKLVARIRFSAIGAMVLDDGRHWVPADGQIIFNALKPFIERLPVLAVK